MKKLNRQFYKNKMKLFVSMTLCFILTSCNVSKENEYTILKGNFIQSITETGELESISASSITMPRISYQYGYNFKLIGLIDHGVNVKKGDSIAALDPSSLYKYIIEREESLEKVIASGEKQKVQMENTIRDLEVQFKNESATVELKKLELERIQFESEIKKRLKELEYQQAMLRLEKVERNLKLKPLIEEFDLAINELNKKQREADIESALGTLKNLILYSPGNGLFQVNNNRRNDQIYKLGDEVYLGSMIAGIPDISRMRVNSYINETDIQKVSVGMKVIVRLDALPDVQFDGFLKQINKICESRDKEKIFRTEIEILESDIRLKPGMSVSCEYVCYNSDSDIFVPNNCLLKENDKAYLYLKKVNSSKKVEVETGPTNSFYTVIKAEFIAGTQLVPFDQVSVN
ncbi:MAG: efflux RND transporter periplasmic adaptor subunit [Bacteroidales bacterium]|nr:efflux RND transporter periplasmic adaptor subunit [Bacteroidales bacterium]